MRLAWTLLPVLLLTACGTLGLSVTRLTDTDYPPTAYAERLRAEPVRPYVEVAEISLTSSADTTTRREAEEQLAEQARSLGADAIILGKSKQTDLRSTDEGARVEESYRYGGIAIRYTDR